MSDTVKSIDKSSLVVELASGEKEGLPYFLISGLGGHVLPLQPMARHVKNRRALGVIFPGFVDTERDYGTVEQTAERMLVDIRATQPSGPYLIVGYSFGGIVGFDIASRLSAAGEKVGLVLIDSRHRKVGRERSALGKVLARMRALLHTEYRNRIFSRYRSYFRARLRRVARTGATAPSNVQQRFASVQKAGWASMRRYLPQPANVPAVLIRSARNAKGSIRTIEERDYGWSRFLNLIGILTVEGDHLEIYKAPYCEDLAQSIEEALQMLEAAVSDS